MDRSKDAATLFLPGAGGRRSFWRPVASRLSLARPAALLAWPGFGDEPSDPGIASLDDLFAWFVDRIPDGPVNVVAQSMGGVLGMRLAIEQPDRVRRLVLVATSGGSKVGRGGIDWRAGFRAEQSDVPAWFERDQTDLDERLGSVTAPTLLIFADADPIAPVRIGEHLRLRLAHARLLVVASGSHTFAAERADEVALAIDEHLRAT
jgi:pimeloyl-ACP methyl ester carboxylesterase